MSKGDKPAVSIAIKPVGGDKSSRVYLLAGWERDGKMSLFLERDVVEFAVKLKDGTIHRVTQGTDESGKKKTSHYFDMFDNREQRAASREQSRAVADDVPYDNLEGDIPF